MRRRRSRQHNKETGREEGRGKKGIVGVMGVSTGVETTGGESWEEGVQMRSGEEPKPAGEGGEVAFQLGKKGREPVGGRGVRMQFGQRPLNER